MNKNQNFKQNRSQKSKNIRVHTIAYPASSHNDIQRKKQSSSKDVRTKLNQILYLNSYNSLKYKLYFQFNFIQFDLSVFLSSTLDLKITQHNGEIQIKHISIFSNLLKQYRLKQSQNNQLILQKGEKKSRLSLSNQNKQNFKKTQKGQSKIQSKQNYKHKQQRKSRFSMLLGIRSDQMQFSQKIINQVSQLYQGQQQKLEYKKSLKYQNSYQQNNIKKNKNKNNSNLNLLNLNIIQQKQNQINTFQNINSFQNKQKSHKFVITQQILLKIYLTKSTHTVSTETSEQIQYNNRETQNALQSFIKYQTLKSKLYQQHHYQQTQILKLINQTKQFKKKYQNLIQTVEQEPSDQRQQRVFQLKQNLQSSQLEVKQAFDKIHQVSTSFHQNLKTKIPLIQKKMNIVYSSMYNLINSVLNQISLDNSQRNNQRIKRILQRALNQLTFLKSIDLSFKEYTKKMFDRSYLQMSHFESCYKNWQSLFYENRVLLYNLMKHIQRISVLMTQLFGYVQEQEGDAKQRDELMSQSYKKYMQSRCEQCYMIKQKSRLLQISNKQYGTIFKSIQYLIRDNNKKKTCLMML